LVPTQLGRHFWPGFALVNGIRIDYLAPTIYLIDVVAIGLIITRIKLFKELKGLKILALVVINILISQNKWVAGIGWMRVIEIYLVYLILKDEKELVLKYLKTIIPFWIIMEAMLGLMQVSKGGSLQGIFYWFGERRFNLNSIGVAKISWWGEEMVRAYGTFSHPNSMAGFLLVALELWKNYEKNLFYWVVRWFGILGIIITASRIIWLLLIFNFQFSIFNLFFIFLFFIFSGWDSLSLIKRMQLNWEAIKMFLKHPLFGVGMNNYLVNSKYFQPVHNVYLLVASEIGIVPISFKLIKLLKLLRRNIRNKVFWIILITGLVDHYWVTLPQNWWLMVIFLSII
jgi:hypothetical protein